MSSILEQGFEASFPPWDELGGFESLPANKMSAFGLFQIRLLGLVAPTLYRYGNYVLVSL